jgi:two-component system nitrogen regulation response regulator GlnG
MSSLQLSPPRLLLVDDEPAIQHAFRRAFAKESLLIHAVGTAREAVAEVETFEPDVVVLDINLPDATGLELFHRLHARDARVPIILITGHGTTDLAIEAIKGGAFEYLLKPLELGELRMLIDRAVQSSRLMRQPASIPEVEIPPPGGDWLLGRCPAMQEVYKAIGRVAQQNVTVLIRGESGTGKELVARAIYQHSLRADRTFLAINCAAIPEALLESELFGHEKGAFTGADRQRIGKFEQCHGGTLFLDEIAEMTPLTQAKVLRLLQEQCFERLGGNQTIHTDVRLLAATNADLEALVEQGRFRKDLYFRLNVFTIWLPPLRERGEDIDLLIDHFSRRYAQELDKPLQRVDPQTRGILHAYPWPGNIRELQSVLKQALLQMQGPVLLPEHLPAALLRNQPLIPISDYHPEAIAPTPPNDWQSFIQERLAAGTENLYDECLQRMEKELLITVLRHTGGNQVQAARLLGITRSSLRNKIRALGIAITRTVGHEDDRAEESTKG